MQDKKSGVFINARFDPELGEIDAAIQGGHGKICFLIGSLIRRVAQVRARVLDIPYEEALAHTMELVDMCIQHSPESVTEIDMSHLKEGNDHDET